MNDEYNNEARERLRNGYAQREAAVAEEYSNDRGYGWGYDEPNRDVTTASVVRISRPKIDWKTHARNNQATAVQLGRKLGKLQNNVAKARNQVTEQCAALKLFGISPTSNQFLLLRNIVRCLKGKNLL